MLITQSDGHWHEPSAVTHPTTFKKLRGQEKLGQKTYDSRIVTSNCTSERDNNQHHVEFRIFTTPADSTAEHAWEP